MKRAVGYYIIVGLIILSLPGCGKIIDWGKSNFYQGQEYNTYKQMAEPFVRSFTLYDQLTTTAHFNAIWLSDEVRTAYTDLHSARLAKSPEHKNIFLRRQLEENNHYISFYVLSAYGTKLGTPESHWTIYLEVDGKNYQPTELKLVELPYEYQVFFGKMFNRFKEPYHLRFNARDLAGNPIITTNTKNINLHVRSAHTGKALTWELKKDSMPQEPVIFSPVVSEKEPVQKSKRHKRGRRQSA